MKERQRFESLDSFRGVFALMVAFMHLQAEHHLYFTAFVRHSFLFVDFFFVLSGWVISYAYLDRLKSGENIRTFVIRRFGRVWPLHIAVLALLIVYQLAALLLQSKIPGILPKPAFSENWDPNAIPGHLVLLQAVIGRPDGSWNLPSWSISVEFWTYILFAAMIYLSPRRWVMIIATAIAVVGLLVVFAVSPRYMDTTFDYGLFRCFGGFFTGVIAQIIWNRTDHLFSKWTWTFAEVVSLALALGFVVASGPTPWAILAPLLFVPTIYVFAHEGGHISGFMRLRWLKILGLWSFSIYMVNVIYANVVFRNLPRLLEKLTGQHLIHNVAFENRDLALLRFPSQWVTDLTAIVYLFFVIATASMSYRFIEVPGRDWFYRLSMGKRKLTGVPSTSLEEAAQ